jgi:hypothetical protein
MKKTIKTICSKCGKKDCVLISRDGVKMCETCDKTRIK